MVRRGNAGRKHGNPTLGRPFGALASHFLLSTFRHILGTASARLQLPWLCCLSGLERPVSRLDFKARGVSTTKIRPMSRERMTAERARLVAWSAAAVTVAYATVYPLEQLATSFAGGVDGWAVVDRGRDHLARLETDDTRGGFLVATDVEREAAAVALDVVVVFDVSGSMEESIAAVRQEAINIIDSLQAESGDVRLGVVSFAEGVPDVLSLGADLVSRFERMQGWTAEGGVNPGEDQFMGIQAALDMDWRDNSAAGGAVARAIIVVTDEPPTTEPDADGNTLASVTQAAVAADVRIYPIIVGDSIDARLSGEAVASASQGRTFSVGSGTEMVGVLLVSIETAIEQADPWMWDAPASFLRALRHAHGQTVGFDLRHSCDTEVFRGEDVVLAGRDIRLVFGLSPEAGIDWRRFEVPLYETAGWRNPATGAEVSDDELMRALATLVSFRVRGEYCVGIDTGAFDNVAIVSAAQLDTQ